jgi:hypothetical protein
MKRLLLFVSIFISIQTFSCEEEQMGLVIVPPESEREVSYIALPNFGEIDYVYLVSNHDLGFHRIEGELTLDRGFKNLIFMERNHRNREVEYARARTSFTNRASKLTLKIINSQWDTQSFRVFIGYCRP